MKTMRKLRGFFHRQRFRDEAQGLKECFNYDCTPQIVRHSMCLPGLHIS